MNSNQLPKRRKSKFTGKDGLSYVYKVSIENSNDLNKYPEGVKIRMTLLRFSPITASQEVVELIDNHPPYGIHRHDKLPGNHSSRIGMDGNWKIVWKIFDGLVRRYKK